MAFDGQVVRLDQLQSVADQFVRVRLTRIDDADLNLFEFDYDLTFMVFFLDAATNVYARYGGRDARDADNRQSLAGLKYTMRSVLEMHQRQTKEFAPKSDTKPKYLRDVTGGRGGHCMHCHQVKEALNRKLTAGAALAAELFWRYPLPENLGLRLEVDRGNVVETVAPGSPAAAVGLRPGDVLKRLGPVPIHSFGDAQFALDKAPGKGSLDVAWVRDDQPQSGAFTLAADWRRTDIAWRASMRRHVPSLPFYFGDDLTEAERKPLGLSKDQLAFRQSDQVMNRAKEAGIRPGDLIVGVQGRSLDLTLLEFIRYVRHNYLAGDRIVLLVIRDGKYLEIPLVLTDR